MHLGIGRTYGDGYLEYARLNAHAPSGPRHHGAEAIAEAVSDAKATRTVRHV